MDLAVIEDWIQARRERTTASDHLTAIDALAILLKGSESPSAVAAIITKAYGSYAEQPPKSSNIGSIHRFWVMLCDAARTFGSAQGRLIDLLYDISAQPDMKATDGSSAMDTSGAIYWRDLPGFPFALSDDALHYFHPYDHSPNELDEFLEQAPYLLNGTRFAATLFERGFYVPRSDFPGEADRFLWHGIESSHNDKHVVKAQAWNVLLPVSSAWIIIAGKTIYQMCLNNTGVWNQQKWEHWKEYLRIFENRDDFNEECRGHATRALEKMIEVERDFDV